MKLSTPRISPQELELHSLNQLLKQAVQAQKTLHKLPSPCLSVCRIQGDNSLCAGCLRTLDEIATWSTLDDAGKRSVWTRIEQRARAGLADSLKPNSP